MEVTSAEIGPDIIFAISLITSLKSFPDLYINDGLVVAPSIIPSLPIQEFHLNQLYQQKISLNTSLLNILL